MGTYNIHGGHNFHVPGASGLFSETSEDRAVKDKVISLLRSQGHTVYDCTDEDATSQRGNLNAIIRKCNAHDVDLDVSIHFNAASGSAHGTEVLIYGCGAGADDAAERICDRIASLGFANRGVKVRKDLAVLNSTHAPALLVECCFCDNDEDYALYNSDSMAYAIVKGITNQNIGGWKQDDKGWWYQNADGSYPVSQWMRLGAWYYFDDKGYAVQKDWKEVNGKKYYFDSNCYMVTGWRYINDKWYYFDGDGEMQTGWIFKGKWYYLDTDGAMLTGKFEVDGYIYYADDNGAMQTGWKQIDSEWYYFNEDKNCQPNGSMLQNHWHNGYYLKDDGKMAHDETIVIGGKEYKFNKDGKYR